MARDQTQPSLIEELECQLSNALKTLSLIKTDKHQVRGTMSEIMEPNNAIYALFINGRGSKASESQIRQIDREDYAISLDVTSGQLSCSLPGQAHKTRNLLEAGIDGVEDILGIMLENPLRNFGNKNIGLFLPHRKIMTPDAFRKAMAKIRYALQGGNQKGPLLLHFDRSHFTVSETGHAWRISMGVGNLCFIRFLLWPERFRRRRRR